MNKQEPIRDAYQFSFRNSQEEPATALPDRLLDRMHDTPKFSTKGHFIFPDEPPRRRPVSAYKKQSVESFGKSSKSHMQLVPLSRTNTRIGKIEINYNTFGVYTPNKSRDPNLSTRSASVRSVFSSALTPSHRSRVKPQTTQQIYMEKMRTPTKSTTLIQPERLVLASRIPKKTIPQAREFNRTFMMQKRIRADRVRELNDSSGRI